MSFHIDIQKTFTRFMLSAAVQYIPSKTYQYFARLMKKVPSSMGHLGPKTLKRNCNIGDREKIARDPPHRFLNNVIARGVAVAGDWDSDFEM